MMEPLDFLVRELLLLRCRQLRGLQIPHRHEKEGQKCRDFINIALDSDAAARHVHGLKTKPFFSLLATHESTCQ